MEWHHNATFRAQTEISVHDIFIFKMKNLAVQEKLCTEPKASPKDALDFAIAYEEGILRQKSYGETKVSINSEPVVTKKKNCLCCETKKFSINHLKVCPSKGKKCNMWSFMSLWSCVPKTTKATNFSETTTAAGELGRRGIR